MGSPATEQGEKAEDKKTPQSGEKKEAMVRGIGYVAFVML